MKEKIEQFVVGMRVENIEQASYYFRKCGTIVEMGHKGGNSVRVQYDDGSTETFVGQKVWLRPIDKQ